MREEGCSSGHKFNITNRFIDGLISLIILHVKMTCHCTFFFILSFTNVIPLVYILREYFF